MRLCPTVLLAALFVASCSSSPPTPNPSVNEREIVGSILQELCAAVLNLRGKNPTHFAADEGWMAAIETNLKTDVEASASPSATLLGPIIPGLLVPKGATAGSYNLAAGGTIDQTATTLRDDKHYIIVELLLSDSLSCPNSAAYRAGIEYQSDGKYLAGNLGIRDWLKHGEDAQNFTALLRPTTGVVPSPATGDGKALSDANAPTAVAKTPSDCPTCPYRDPNKFSPNPPWNWFQGKSFNTPLDPMAFVDPVNPKNPMLTYSARLDGGQPLPPWLSFNPVTRTFSGMVPVGQQGVSIEVTARRGNLSGSGILTVATPCDECPYLVNKIMTPAWRQKDLVPYVFPKDRFTDPKNLELTYDAKIQTETGTAELPDWLSFDPATRRFSGTVPASQQGIKIRMTVTNTNKLSAWAIMEVSTPPAPAPSSQPAPEPKVTSGPTYTATFTFLTKGSGQLGPSFSMDRAKGGGASLFSLSRTETNYVNIALTAAGVRLELEKPKAGKALAGNVAAPYVGAVNSAIQRLDMSLQQLNLSHVIPVQP
jgi:hypothetical protein